MQKLIGSHHQLKCWGQVLKKNWSNTSDVFEIGCKNWIISLDSVLSLSAKSKKKAYAAFSKITNLFSFKGAV